MAELPVLPTTVEGCGLERDAMRLQGERYRQAGVGAKLVEALVRVGPADSGGREVQPQRLQALEGFARCPRQESNLDSPLRRRLSYPLDYEGAAAIHDSQGAAHDRQEGYRPPPA